MNSFITRIWRNNAEKLDEICNATRYSPSKAVNMMVEYALKHVRLAPTTAAVYDMHFWNGTAAPSYQNAREMFPQLNDRFSGLKD